MFAVKLWGGLGNQMFQYAFALHLAKSRNDFPYFFTDGVDQNLADFAINNFNLDLAKLPVATQKSLGYTFNSNLHYRLIRKLLQIFPFLNRKILVEKGLEYKPSFSEMSVLFDGYWQSYKYIASIEDQLREKFVFKDQKLNELDNYEDIVSSNSVSLHIRKGDYLKGKNVNIFEACPLAYYIKAVNLIKAKIELPVFFVFSNDLNWAKENLKFEDNVELRFVDNSKYKDPTIADIFLMSKCKHNIIANSTFSWWGAWLNSFANKIIIAPAKWYVGILNKVTVDLIPPNWIRL